MTGSGGHRRDQGDRGGTGTDDHYLLSGVIEILRPVLRVHDLTAEVALTGEGGAVSLVVVVVTTGADEDVRGPRLGLPRRLDQDGHGPLSSRAIEVHCHDLAAEVDVVGDAVFLGGFLDVVTDTGAVCEHFGSDPRTETESEGEHVGIRTDAGILEQVPGATDVLAAFEDRVSASGLLTNEVASRADSGQASADDQYVDMLCHEETRFVGRREATSGVGSDRERSAGSGRVP